MFETGAEYSGAQGTISIRDDVVETIGRIAAAAVPGVVSDNADDKMLERSKFKLRMEEGAYSAWVSIRVQTGALPIDTARQVQAAVTQAISVMTGCVVSAVNVHVFGIIMEGVA